MNFSAPHDKFSMTDEALIEMLKVDHEWALKEIFTRYNVRLFRMAVGVLRDEALAKDLVQDVFIDLWNRRHTSNIEALANYLVRAIKFQVLKQIRNGKLHDRHLKMIEHIQFANQTEDSLNLKELEISLKNAVEQLSPKCREVFELSRYENLSHKEISSRLNISTKTVEAQIGKALSFLRASLDKTLVIVVSYFF